MKINFKNHGLIFDIRDHNVFSDYEFAQSPQLLRIGEKNRVYFSTRLKNFERYPKSQILYVDFDRDFKNILNYGEHCVLEDSQVGTYDEHGVFPIHIQKLRSGALRAYLSGWSRRVSVPVETAIGVAESHDGGKTFQRVGPGPVLSASPEEPFLVGDPFVWEGQSENRMFYIAGKSWSYFPGEKMPQRVYKIRAAVSKDGFSWHRLGRDLVADSLGPGECQALPSVTDWGDGFLMAFCFRQPSKFRENPKRGYRLGFAESQDLNHWSRIEKEVQIEHSTWDSEMQCYPYVFKNDGNLKVLYNGNQFGKHGFGLLCETED